MTVADLLAGLARANVAAAVAVVVVLVLRAPARRLFGARAAYALWLLPLLAAAAVLIPHPQIVTPISPLLASASVAADEFVSAAPAQASGPDAQSLMVGAWTLGAVLMAGLLLRRQVAFVGSLGRLERISESGRGRVFRAERAGVGPAVVGVFRPRIVAPADFETLYGPAERDLILAHETAHLRTGDAGVNGLVCALQCLGWFNPLAHVAARLLRVDQELACDAAVIGAFPAQRKTYAELLLKTQLFTQPLPLGCHWPAGAEHPLKERIAMLKSPLPGRGRRVLGLAVVTGLSAAGAAGAWATGASPGAAERAEALRQLAAHPSYTCDPELEAKGVGCKVIKQSMWLAVPTPAEVARAYPAAARAAGEAARVQLACKTTPGGLLTGCLVMDLTVRTPDGGGGSPENREAFRMAAVQLSRYYQARQAPSPPNPPPREGVASFFITFGEAPQETAAQNDAAPAGTISRVEGRTHPAAARSGVTQVALVKRYTSYMRPLADAPSIEAGPADAKVAPVVTQPDWVKKPDGADIADVYPPEAAKTGLAGATTIACTVSAEGRLEACQVMSEAPVQAGFGAAALKLSERFQMKPMSRDGHPVAGGYVRIPIRFMVPTPSAPPQP